MSGVVNYSGYAKNAIQIAGVANIASQGNVTAQIGGVFNSAKQVKGVQIGVINYADPAQIYSIKTNCQSF